MKKYIPLFLAALFLINLAGCAPAAVPNDLMSGVFPQPVLAKEQPPNIFQESMAAFSIDLFKQSAHSTRNSLVSPLSVTLALAMAANGADGNTLAQMEALLCGGTPISGLNDYLYNYTAGLPSTSKSKLSIANSIWLRGDGSLRVEPAFLQTNADYYGAAAYKAAFDAQTVKDVNNWVKENTGGLIKEILREIDPDEVMYLINAILFDAEWARVYYKENLEKGTFTDVLGNKQTAEFMHSSEYQYLSDGKAAGFIKHYANRDYSFAALLPNEDIPIGEYIQSLTGAGFLHTIQNAAEELVYAALPKFSYEFDIEMNDALIALGIPGAFDPGKADFSRMAANRKLFINRVIHKTYISVDELGTKAGAATMVAVDAGSAAPAEPKTVRLDRPFIYAIIDNAAGLPIFIGAVMSVD